MKPVLIALVYRLGACVVFAAVFCAIVWLLALLGLCETPSWQMFMAVAVFVFAFIVIRDTYLYFKDK